MKNRRIIHFRNYSCYNFTFKLGQNYTLNYKRYNKIITVRFIKVTPKGFNLLNLKTSKCLFKSHLYDSKWTGKNIPINETEFTVKVSAHLPIPIEVKNEQTKCS
jgi:hypothetical protein